MLGINTLHYTSEDQQNRQNTFKGKGLCLRECVHFALACLAVRLRPHYYLKLGAEIECLAYIYLTS
jgi:hypothetical protein